MHMTHLLDGTLYHCRTIVRFGIQSFILYVFVGTGEPNLLRYAPPFQGATHLFLLLLPHQLTIPPSSDTYRAAQTYILAALCDF